ncbi:CGNR zinc finger domain-containing protein [Nonomuraea sp. NPDC046570]|uniref:CGNR zinc finger domain-containing protein n=1 Tax=Nonomuraea sp. NPDC046570 TaxID=3155255 RepID=UPI003410666A
MDVYSTKAVARRAVVLCDALLHQQAGVEGVRRILREHGEKGPFELVESDVEEMRAAAAVLVAVLAAPTPAAAARLLNDLLSQSTGSPRLTSHGGTTSWHLHVDGGDDAPWAEWFLASSALSFAVLLTDHQRFPGGLCASRTCRRPYLDVGGGSVRRFCSTRCATRERVAAHRASRPPSA